MKILLTLFLFLSLAATIKSQVDIAGLVLKCTQCENSLCIDSLVAAEHNIIANSKWKLETEKYKQCAFCDSTNIKINSLSYKGNRWALNEPMSPTKVFLGASRAMRNSMLHTFIMHYGFRRLHGKKHKGEYVSKKYPGIALRSFNSKYSFETGDPNTTTFYILTLQRSK